MNPTSSASRVVLSTTTILFITALLLLSGCARVYYGVQEKLGNEKRDILVSRVAKGQKDQEAAREQFQSAFDEFSQLVNFNGGDLRTAYDKLNSEFTRCESRAQAVTDRIDSIEKVAKDMFAEWETELEAYKSPELRRSSEKKLRETRTRFDVLLASMRRVESRMAPVLDAFRDQVLFLKHNLNAQSVASLQNEVNLLETTVADLIREMNESIAEANTFIAQMEGT